MNRWLPIFCFVLASVACGDDEPSHTEGAVEPPSNPERALIERSGPQGDIEQPEFAEEEVPQEPVLAPGAPACCDVEFAFGDTQPEEKVFGFLRGTESPLNSEEGVELEFSDGAWRATVCMPPDYAGTYHYEFALQTSDPDTHFMVVLANPFVRSEDDGLNNVNVWESAASCDELDASQHSKISE